MESTRRKAFTQFMMLSSTVAVLSFIPLIYHALSAASHYKVYRVTNGDTIKVENNGKISDGCANAGYSNKTSY